MRPRETPTRLELHRVKYHKLGRRGPLLRLDLLDDEEKELIQDELLKAVRFHRLNFNDPLADGMVDILYLGVLTEFGVMCTHPPQSRIPGRKIANTCGLCNCPLVDAVTITFRGIQRKTR